MSATYPGAFSLGGSTAGARRATDLTATWKATTARRKLQVALGLLWLVDAALQYQPYMFGRTFVTDTIEPTASGAPWIVAHPTLWAAHFMIHHITVYNSVFATIQLLIAATILYRPTVRLGLAVSVVWGLGVWWLAEGIGGIFDNASPLTGAPGAVILYVLIALLVWPRTEDRTVPGASVAQGGVVGPLAPKALWAALWVGLALLILESTNRSPTAIHEMIAGAESGEPSWVKAMLRALASPAANHGTEISIGLAVLFAVIALAVLTPRTARIAVILGVLLGILTWLIEAFGGIATGSGTDVNSGLVLILLSACYWPLASSQRSPRSLTGAHEVHVAE